MNFNFELILFYAVIVTGIIALIDILFFSAKRKRAHADKNKNLKHPPALKLPLIIDYARAFFPVLLLVFLLRSFLYEPFRIPSGSLKPTLLVGDFILVNKFDYGVRLPVIHTKVFNVGKPLRGDIFVFRYPPDPSIDYIKRVIGVPGDHVSYANKILSVNGHEIPQEFVKDTIDIDEDGDVLNVQQKEENFFGIKHAIYQNLERPSADFQDLVVPPNVYFAMGDNRDNSADSRVWGFVPEENIVGKAIFTWMSWDSQGSLLHKIRWDRIGKPIH